MTYWQELKILEQKSNSRITAPSVELRRQQHPWPGASVANCITDPALAKHPLATMRGSGRVNCEPIKTFFTWEESIFQELPKASFKNLIALNLVSRTFFRIDFSGRSRWSGQDVNGRVALGESFPNHFSKVW
jgi:hypothetical protein